MGFGAYIAKKLLKWGGWTVNVELPDFDKSIICVAPHTSNWDFIICELAYLSLGRRSGFLMKKDWFFFPLGNFFRAIGGVPVDRSRRTDLKVRKKLIELLTDDLEGADNPLMYAYEEIVERLADYLLKNGVIVPPCKSTVRT